MANRAPLPPRSARAEFKYGFFATVAFMAVGVAILLLITYAPPADPSLLKQIALLFIQGGFGAILGLIGGKFTS